MASLAAKFFSACLSGMVVTTLASLLLPVSQADQLPCHAVEATGQCTTAADDDETAETSVLQLGRGRRAALAAKTGENVSGDLVSGGSMLPCWGITVRPTEPGQCDVLVKKGLVKGNHLGWWNAPRQQDLAVLDRLKAGLAKRPWGNMSRNPWPDLRAGPARDVMQRMYEGTKVRGVFERVPRKLQGVFWMKGNCLPEELAVLQYGHWYEKENLFVSMTAPFSWAYPGGKPKDAPCYGTMYSNDESVGRHFARTFISLGLAFSFKFGDCEGNYCRDSPQPNDMAYAYIQQSYAGNLVNSTVGNSPLPNGLVAQAWTMEDTSGNGTKWRRVCAVGLGTCAFSEMGSYDLLKVIDGDGRPVQPYHDEFIQYMGDVPLLTWTGWASRAAKDDVVQAYCAVASQNLTNPPNGEHPFLVVEGTAQGAAARMTSVSKLVPMS